MELAESEMLLMFSLLLLFLMCNLLQLLQLQPLQLQQLLLMLNQCKVVIITNNLSQLNTQQPLLFQLFNRPELWLKSNLYLFLKFKELIL